MLERRQVAMEVDDGVYTGRELVVLVAEVDLELPFDQRVNLSAET